MRLLATTWVGDVPLQGGWTGGVVVAWRPAELDRTLTPRQCIHLAQPIQAQSDWVDYGQIQLSWPRLRSAHVPDR